MCLLCYKFQVWDFRRTIVGNLCWTPLYQRIFKELTKIFYSGGLMGRYCGNVPPPDLTSSDSMVTIMFTSDHSIAGDGFTASYVLLDTRTQCGGHYTTDTGVIRSPGYPQPYPHSRYNNVDYFKNTDGSFTFYIAELVSG